MSCLAGGFFTTEPPGEYSQEFSIHLMSVWGPFWILFTQFSVSNIHTSQVFLTIASTAIRQPKTEEILVKTLASVISGKLKTY